MLLVMTTWTLYVDDDTRDLAEALAKAEDRSVSAYVRQLIKREHAAMVAASTEPGA